MGDGGELFILQSPAVGRPLRRTYPVRAKLAQYLIIFLLSNFSSSVAPSEGDNHKIWLPGLCARSQGASHVMNAFHIPPPVSFILHLQVLRLETPATCWRKHGLQVVEAEHTSSLGTNALLATLLRLPVPGGQGSSLSPLSKDCTFFI